MIEQYEDGMAKAVGHIAVWSIDEQTGEKTFLFEQPNLILYTWAPILIGAAFQGNLNYKISGAYMEYYNVASPGNTVTVPSYGRGDGLSYYNTLASPGDFLRVPLSALPNMTIQSGYETYFTAPNGNVATSFIQTSGTTGILGRPFADTSNSKVFGVALIATPSWSDRTQDLIFARTYFATNKQQLKVAGSQIGVTWSIPLL